ncbi:MAG: tetratricopeptide repeat protein [Candidatus Aenigmarchaeota archaeon]|nr:tetratricopeptide repeat protein [Candidatus Aenigmarchaeota archaeon]
MNVSNIVRSAFLGGALAFGGCAVERSVRELHQQGVQYSIDEVLQAYISEIKPLYVNPDPSVALNNMSENRDVIFELMRVYFSNVDEQSVESADASQRQMLAAAYGDYCVATMLVRGRQSVDGAILLLERAIELDPNNSSLYFNYANLLWLDESRPESERSSLVLRALDNCLRLDPSNVNAQTAKANLEQYLREHR